MGLWLGPLAETFLLQEFILLQSITYGAFPIFFNYLISFFICLSPLFSFSTRTFNMLIIMICLSMLFVFILNIHLVCFRCFVLCVLCIMCGVLRAFQSVDLFFIKIWKSIISSILSSPSKTLIMLMLDDWILSHRSAYLFILTLSFPLG